MQTRLHMCLLPFVTGVGSGTPVCVCGGGGLPAPLGWCFSNAGYFRPLSTSAASIFIHRELYLSPPPCDTLSSLPQITSLDVSMKAAPTGAAGSPPIHSFPGADFGEWLFSVLINHPHGDLWETGARKRVPPGLDFEEGTI